MQPQRLHFSRLGTAFLQRSASSSRYHKRSPVSLPCALNIRRYSTEEHQSTANSDRTKKDVANQPLSNRTPDIPILRSAVRSGSDPTRQKVGHGLKSPEHGPKDASPDLDTISESGQEAGWQKTYRMMWRPKKIERIREERIAEELKPVLEDRLADDTEGVEVPRARRRDGKRPGKKQRFKRGKARIWKLLDMAKEQLELTEIRIEAFRQLVVVKKLLGVIGNQLKIVGRQTETWRQLNLAEKRSDIIERELETMERQIDTWRQFDLAEKQGEFIGRELETTSRRIEAWSQLVLVEQRLESVERQLHFVRSQLGIFRMPMDTSTIQKKTVQRRGRKRSPLSNPSAFLNGWLNTLGASERERYWLKNKGRHGRFSLPLLLVAYLRLATNAKVHQDDFDQSIIQNTTAELQKRGFAVKDLAEWAWILSAQDTKTTIGRFFSTTSRKPSFLLLEILKRESLDVRSLKLLLIYSWDQLLRIPRTNLATKSDVEIDSIIPWSTMRPLPGTLAAQYTEPSFSAIFHSLLRQARRIWPAAIVSISHMVEPFIHLHLGSGSGEVKKVDNQRHARLCMLYNRVLCVLALPSSINPLKSMVYNWQAQRVLLEMSTRFEPPLLLDRYSYRAVAQVLAASKKSERESRAANLRTRSWPPWRVVQDGMDAQRPPEDDLSRVVVTANQAKGSGYGEEKEDRFIRIIGGQEPDGTPTIPTRKLLRLRRVGSRRVREASFYRTYYHSEAGVWAARIESTRDIQEAWAAFLGYQEQGLQPSMSIYYSMFVKLHYEARRSAFQPISSPGDGKEVLEPSNDNFSSFYQSRLQPPSIDELYKQMRHAGIGASGRFLAFLVSRARTPFDGIKYLLDSRVDRRAVEFLGGVRTKNPVFLKFVSEETFTAFIKLLCRLAPRIVPATATSTLQREGNDGGEDTDSLAPETPQWKLLDLRNKHLNPRLLNPLLHCARLLNISQTRYRPAWYALFAGLVRRGVVVDRSLIGDPKNDIVAWKVLVAALGDFHRYGLELDPPGFQILCIGLEKALLASFKVPEDEREGLLGKDQVGIVVNEFMKLSEVRERSHLSIPKLLHPIEGSHLHHYVRVLGINEDYDGLKYVLRWMVKYHVELDDIALQSRNGSNLIQRALIAMKVFLGRTEYEPEAEELVNSVETWGGWPVDIEAQAYLDRSSGWTDGDERESGYKQESSEERKASNEQES